VGREVDVADDAAPDNAEEEPFGTDEEEEDPSAAESEERCW